MAERDKNTATHNFTNEVGIRGSEQILQKHGFVELVKLR